MTKPSHIQIDIWGGDMHMNLIRSRSTSCWKEAAQIIEREVEAGNLANVLHTDFKAPAGAADAAMQRLIEERNTPHA